MIGSVEDTFDPKHADKSDMKRLATGLRKYLDLLDNVMVIPPDVQKKHGDRIEEGIRRTKKLIKKLEKGDKSIFKDADD